MIHGTIVRQKYCYGSDYTCGLNLALSYENAAVDRLQKRLSESIVPEVKDKLTRHLVQTREQQEHRRDQSAR